MAEQTVSTLKRTTSATEMVTITDNLATHLPAKAVYIGADDDYEFTANGTDWVPHTGAKAGSQISVAARGARHLTGGTAPDANDIVFYY